MKILIVGRGGSGKDFLKAKFVKQGSKGSVNITTRPKRSSEVDGVHYNFVNDAAFRRLIAQNQLQEWDEFNGWLYGTTKMEWKRADVFIKTPHGVAQISKTNRKTCFVIYLDIEESTRFVRLRKRQDADNVWRRIEADKEDFADFTDYDLRITNDDF